MPSISSEQLLNEIREANLSYLMLAQHLIRSDRGEAMARLGLSEESAELIATLSPAQLTKLAAGSTLLCRFRVDDELVWSLLTQHGRATRAADAAPGPHAATPRIGEAS